MASTRKHGLLNVAIRCDAYSTRGVGHLVRQLSLAEGLQHLDHRVRLFGDSDLVWARNQIRARGLELELPGSTDEFVENRAADSDVVMIDGYEFPAELGLALIGHGVPTATMVDGDFGRHQPADLYVDQNLGAVPPRDPGAATWLVGPDYVLLRDQVLKRRPVEPRRPNDPLRVLVVFGGTDAFGGCVVGSRLLLGTGAPVHVVAVAATPQIAEQLSQLKVGPQQVMTVEQPADDLPLMASECDAALSAAGTSMWEFACMGVPTALVCVVDNQLLGYRAATADLALPVGKLERLRDEPDAQRHAQQQLKTLLTDADLRRRLAVGGMRLVDGNGRDRVIEALRRLI